MDELVRPAWRNFLAYIDALRTGTVRASVEQEMVRKYDPKHGLRFGCPDAHTEVSRCLPGLTRDLRLFDTTDVGYWLLAFFGVFLFLNIELILFLNLDSARTDYRFAVSLLFVLIFIVCCCLLGLVILLVRNQADGCLPRWLYSVPSSALFAIPVVIVSGGLLALNLALVVRTGWHLSPFMPALSFVALSIMAAPRENSKPIVVLSLVAMLVVVFPFWCAPSQSPQQDILSLSKEINLITLLCSGVVTLALRQRSANKLL